MALLSHVVFPRGTTGFSDPDHSFLNKVNLPHQITEDLSLSYNLGYNVNGGGTDYFVYILALGVAVNDKVGIYKEPYGEFVDLDDHLTSFDGGFTYSLKPTIQLDDSFGTGLNYEMNYLAAGCSFVFKKKLR